MLDLDSDESRQDIVQELMDEGRNIAEDDVMNLINTIMENTKSETIESNTGDPFWEKGRKVFLQALFYYVIFNYPIEERNFRKIMELFVRENLTKKEIQNLETYLMNGKVVILITLVSNSGNILLYRQNLQR